MIIWNEKTRRSKELINAVINELYKDEICTDGIADYFNNGKEQGCILKIYDKYNPVLDLCIWTYMPLDRNINNEIMVLIGKHTDCDKNNIWNKKLEEHNFNDNEARQMHNKARDFILDAIHKNFEKTHDIPKI